MTLFWSTPSFFGRNYYFYFGVEADGATVSFIPRREYIEGKWQLRFKNIIQKKWYCGPVLCKVCLNCNHSQVTNCMSKARLCCHKSKIGTERSKIVNRTTMIMNAPVEPEHQRRCCWQYEWRNLLWTTKCLQFAITAYTIMSKGKWLIVNCCEIIKIHFQRWNF